MVEHYWSVKENERCQTRPVTYSTLVVGSLGALRAGVEEWVLAELDGDDALIVPTAAAFTGAAEAAIGVAEVLE